MGPRPQVRSLNRQVSNLESWTPASVCMQVKNALLYSQKRVRSLLESARQLQTDDLSITDAPWLH